MIRNDQRKRKQEKIMGDTAVIRYEMKADRAEENQRLVEEVFAELAKTEPEGLSYACFRLADGVTFIHVVTTEGEENPLMSLPAFARFQEAFGERVEVSPVRNAATVVGAYNFSSKK